VFVAADDASIRDRLGYHSFIAGVAVRRLAEIVLIAGTTICDAILVRLLKREATSIVEVERGLIELSMS